MKSWLPWQIRRRFEHVAHLLQRGEVNFDPTEIYVPQEKTDRGDALGWLGYSFEVKGHAPTVQNVLEHLGLPDTRTFYDRMSAIDPQWKESAHRCAAALLKYSEVNHSDPPKDAA